MKLSVESCDLKYIMHVYKSQRMIFFPNNYLGWTKCTLFIIRPKSFVMLSGASMMLTSGHAHRTNQHFEHWSFIAILVTSGTLILFSRC